MVATLANGGIHPATNYEKIEIIIVDDGSTDPTTIAELTVGTGRVKLVRQSNQNLGRPHVTMAQR